MDHDPSVPAAEDETDLDRRAILARRNKFVALALAGLGGAAGCAARQANSEAPEQVASEDDEGDESADDGDDSTAHSEAAPTRQRPRPHRTRPQACLRVALDDDDGGPP